MCGDGGENPPKARRGTAAAKRGFGMVEYLFDSKI
jgi:hypothetical protein